MDLIIKNNDVPRRAPASALEIHEAIFPPPLESSDDVLRFRKMENAVAASAAEEAMEPKVRNCFLRWEISPLTLSNSLTSSVRFISLSAMSNFFRVCKGLIEESFRSIRGPSAIVRGYPTAVPNPAAFARA